MTKEMVTELLEIARQNEEPKTLECGIICCG